MYKNSEWNILLLNFLIETEVPGENHRPAISHWQTLSHNVVHLTLNGIQTHISGWSLWYMYIYQWQISINCIDGVVISMLVSSAVDRGVEPRFDQTKYCKIGICCFSAKHVAFRRKSEDGLAFS
jgi:hypothetical protein